MKITWDKEIRDRAKADGKGLFAFGSDTKAYKWVMGGPMDHDKAVKLTLFVITFNKTGDPKKAYEAAWGKDVQPGEDAT